MRFLGSAARLPHVQGAFSESVAVRADQCIPIPASMSFRIAACAEPLAVALHAVHRAGPLQGRHVVIAGAGPIGLLCLASALHAGVASATVLDISAEPLLIARQMGADAIIQVASESDGAALVAARHGGFDIAFEASGAPASLAALVPLTRRGGRIVQIGLFPQGDLPLNVNMLMTREIDLVGSFRFDQEFAMAVELLAAGKIDTSPILTTILPIDRALDAFDLAADREKSIKVQLAIG
jgi:L-idonate 5-dehydrogenase